MSEIEVILAAKLKETEPTLDVFGADRKVLQVATQDLAGYLRYLAYKDEHGVRMGFTPLEQLQKEEPHEVNAFLTAWIGLWLKKWKQRFALSLTQNRPQPTQNAQNPQKTTQTNDLWTNLPCRQEMTEMVIMALIKSSEICGSKIMAEDLLKQEIQKTTTQTLNPQQLFTILNRALQKAKEIHQRSGPIVRIRVEKEYYNEIGN